jgi:hypothetical protein
MKNLSKNLLERMAKINPKDVQGPTGEVDERFEEIIDYEISDDLKRLFGLEMEIKKSFEEIMELIVRKGYPSEEYGESYLILGREFKEIHETIWNQISSEIKEKGLVSGKLNFRIKKDWKAVKVDKEKMINCERNQRVIDILKDIIYEYLLRAVPGDKVEEFEGINNVIEETIDQAIETNDDKELKEKLNEFFVKKSEEVLGDARDAIEAFSNILESVDFRRELSCYTEKNLVIHLVEIIM